MVVHAGPKNQKDEVTSAPPPTFFTNGKNKGWWSVARQKPPEHLSYREKQNWYKERARFLGRDAELSAMEQYRLEGNQFDPSHDIRMDGGLGKFALLKTMVGVSWTTMRAAAAFVLTVKIIRGSHDTFPGAISLAILFTTVQTYSASRSMPRIIYLILALDLFMCYGALVLTLYGLVMDKDKYGKIGVGGGSCPYYSENACYTFNPLNALSSVGCTANLTRTANMNSHDYPPNQDGTFDGADPSDPNTHGVFHAWYAQVGVGFAGALYGLISLLFIPMWIGMAFFERKPLRPLPVIKMASVGRLSYNVAKVAFITLLILAAITIPVHLVDELRAGHFYYFDSFGPVVSLTGQERGAGGSWTDCFAVRTDIDTAGHLKEWWAVKESRALRILAGL